MGAKTAVKLRNRGAAYKCDMCGRKLMTPDALVVHQRTAHNIITRRTKPKQVIKPVKASKFDNKANLERKPLPTIKNPPKTSEKKAASEKEAVRNDPNKDDQSEQKTKTVEFECPKCFRIFLTYFPAHKHIQKYHCVNRQGVKVPPNSPYLIQPVRIELCLKCNRKVKSIQTHVCDNKIKERGDGRELMCTACEERFPNLKSFNMHVFSSHGDDVESMFFPTSLEFARWKTEMESQTKVSYAILDNYDSKRYYHCNFVKEGQENSNTMYFCPSTIVIQEFSKGIQVHYYKKHYKHYFSEYNLSDKYKRYSITSFLKRSEDYNNLPTQGSCENDMYIQFKNLMEGIVIDAAKINIPALKVLIGKALDMTSILTNYDEEADDNSVEVNNSSQNMNDSQITKALEDRNLNLGKRKTSDEDSLIDTKRMKIEALKKNDISPITSSPKIINSFSLADNVDKDKYLKDENKSNNISPLKQTNDIDQSPSSFNDSYKDFVVKNFACKEVKPQSRVGRPLKTKIGQFKPNTSPRSNNEPKKIESDSKKVESDPKKVESDPKKVESDLKKVEPAPKKVEPASKKIEPASKKIELASKKVETASKKVEPASKKVEPASKKVEPASKKVEPASKKVEPVSKKVEPASKKVEPASKKVESDSKKVGSEPKKIESRKLNRISLDKPKVDFEYEVKEQEGGYNILILKI